MQMHKVFSRDGAPIVSYWSGTGPPLILVPGAGAANPTAWPVFSQLAERFTVYAVDRRGHGSSGDGPAYAIAREFEDIAAVVDSLVEPANLLGHSFGATCALGAGLLTPQIRRLVLYEPSISLPGRPLFPEGAVDRLQARLDAGDREGTLVTFYREIAGLSPEQIDGLKASLVWPERLAAAHTLPRELRAEEHYLFEPRRYRELRTPTLLLLGGDSPPMVKEDTEALAAALSNSRIAVLPEQGHIAMYTAPEIFLEAVLAFLTD